MKTVTFGLGIKLAAVCCLFFGVASAYAGNVSMGINFGWPFYVQEPIVYVSPAVTHVSHTPYFGHRPRGHIYAGGHARPGNYHASRYQHQRVQYQPHRAQHQQRSPQQHQQRQPQRSDHRR